MHYYKTGFNINAFKHLIVLKVFLEKI